MALGVFYMFVTLLINYGEREKKILSPRIVPAPGTQSSCRVSRD